VEGGRRWPATLWRRKRDHKMRGRGFFEKPKPWLLEKAKKGSR